MSYTDSPPWLGGGESGGGGGGGDPIVRQFYYIYVENTFGSTSVGHAHLYRRGRERWICGFAQTSSAAIDAGDQVLVELGAGDAPDSLPFGGSDVPATVYPDYNDDVVYGVRIVGSDVVLVLPDGKPTGPVLNVRFNGVWLTE